MYHPQSQDLVNTLEICCSLTRNEALKAPLLAAIHALIQAHDNAAAAQQEFQRSPINTSFLLSALLHCLSTIDSAASLTEADLLRILERFHWHRSVLQEVAGIVVNHGQDIVFPADDIYAICKNGLLSENPEIRLNTLLLLQRGWPTSETIRRALDVERVPLTPQDARDKNMQLRRLGAVAKNLDELANNEMEMALLYLFAMMKVNFKPLWSETIEVIAEISKTRPSSQTLIWRILSQELQAVAAQDMRALVACGVPPWGDSASEELTHTKVALWRQGDLFCTAFTRWSVAYAQNVGHFLELSTPAPRTVDQRQIQVSHFVIKS